MPMPKTPPRPAPQPAAKAAPVKPSTTQPPRIQTPTPASQKNMTPPQYVPMGPGKPAVSGGDMAKVAAMAKATNAGMPSRGGTPVTVKNAPGYRGSGTQPMPSSQPRGFSKGGSASKRADGIAIRGKTRA